MMTRGLLAFFTLLIFSQVTFAASQIWKITPSKSSLTFIGIQNGSPATGEFKKFSGDVNFDPDHMGESKAKIIVDMNSISASYAQLVGTLKSSEWFDVKLFPQAIFEANEFIKTGDKTYQAKGMLTIRDKTVPTTVTFEEQERSATKAKVKGQVILKRLAFGVGTGEWADTDLVKDDVQVDFAVVAEKK